MERSEFNPRSHEYHKRGEYVDISVANPEYIVEALANTATDTEETLYYTDRYDYATANAPSYLESLQVSICPVVQEYERLPGEPHSALVLEMRLTDPAHDHAVLTNIEKDFTTKSSDYTLIEQGDHARTDTILITRRSPADHHLTSQLQLNVIEGSITCAVTCESDDDYLRDTQPFDHDDYRQLIDDHTAALATIIDSVARTYDEPTRLQPITLELTPSSLDQPSSRSPLLPADHHQNSFDPFAYEPSQPQLETSRQPKPRHMDTIGGLTAAKERLQQIKHIVQYPELAKEYGVSGQHFMLYGPPGTGKTSLTRAFAEELGAEYIQVDNTKLADKYIGQSARNLKDIFDEAKQLSAQKLTVLCFEEFDSLAATGGRTHEEYQKAINELKLQLDTISSAAPQLIIAATTNKLPSEFDEAIIRAGRIEPIAAPAPTEIERAEIWHLVLASTQRVAGYDWDIERALAHSERDVAQPHELAKITEDLTGADFKAILNAASMAAFLAAVTTGEKRDITHADLTKAVRVYRQTHAR